MVSSVFIVAHLDLGKSSFHFLVVTLFKMAELSLIAIVSSKNLCVTLWFLVFCFFAQVYSTLRWLPSADMRLGRVGAGDIGPWWGKEEGDEGKEGWEE